MTGQFKLACGKLTNSGIAEAPRGRVTGTLNTSQVGGSGLQVFSVFDGLAPSTNGSFSTQVSADKAQALLVLDGSQKLRAMAINLPGESPAVDARSTALAIVFLTPGISTTDPETARRHLLAIQAAPGFGAFVQLCQAVMLTQDLASAMQSPTLRAARDLVVDQVLASLAQVLPRSQQEEDQIQSDGYIVLAKDDASTATQLKIQLSNEGYRFVKVVREEHFNGLSQPAIPLLQGSPTGSSIMGGRGGVSVAALLSLLIGGTIGAPGAASDVIDQSQHTTERVTYYIRGFGNPHHASRIVFPSHIRPLMSSLGDLDLAMTAFFYFMLPVIEPVLFIFTGLSGEQALSAVGRALGPLFATASAEAGALSAITAEQAGDQPGFLLALTDVFVGLSPIILRAIVALFGQTFPAVVVLEAALTAAGFVFAIVNAGPAFVAAYRTPMQSDAELVLINPLHFLEQKIAENRADFRRFVNLAQDGSLVYAWFDSSPNDIRRVNRLKIPPLGSPYAPEVTFNLSETVVFIAGNSSGELLAQVNESFSGPNRVRNSFFLYQLPDAGFGTPTSLGQVTWNNVAFAPNGDSPGPDRDFRAEAINSQGDIAGTYEQFHRWNEIGPSVFVPSHILQVWWIPKGGTLIQRDINAALLAQLASSHPMERPEAMFQQKIFGLNRFGELLVGCQYLVRQGDRSVSEQVVASYNLFTGRVILLSRALSSGVDTDLTIVAGKINDSGQVAISLSQTGIFFGRFFNGIAPAGEPVPVAIGFKDSFVVNDLTSDGQVAGFVQVVGTPGVTGRAAIWRAAGSGEVVDVHAQLATQDRSIQEPYSSSLARMGDDGTLVGVVITKQPTNPDLPVAPDNPEIDLLRDFVIQGTTAP